MTDTNESPRQPRIFKIGTTRIVEDDSLHGFDAEGVHALLKGRRSLPICREELEAYLG